MDDLCAELAAQTGRLADRLRGLALTRLQAPYDPEPTRVHAARDLAQRLADAAAGCEDPSDRQGQTWRDVPDVGAAAVGDLVAVTASDLCAALAGDPEWIRTRGGGTSRPAELVAELAVAARDLRRRL